MAAGGRLWGAWREPAGREGRWALRSIWLVLRNAAGVCWFMLVYAGKCWYMLVRMQLYADTIRWYVLAYAAIHVAVYSTKCGYRRFVSSSL